MHGGNEELPGVNMTAMIDIVFMLVVFFILTVKMEEATTNDQIKLAMAPNARPVMTKDPRTISIDVDERGHILINRTVLPLELFRSIMRKTVAESGKDTPVVINGDGAARHEDIRKVMDVCSSVGIWKQKFAALKEKGS